MRYVQRESFAGLQDERIASLNPFLDEEGITRLRTRIVERADVGDWDTSSVAFPSPHSREARVEHTSKVMPRCGTGTIESLA